MASKDKILEALAFLAAQAETIAETALAQSIEGLIAAHSQDSLAEDDVVAEATEGAAAPATIVEPAPTPIDEVDEGEVFDGDPLDAELGALIDDAFAGLAQRGAAALPALGADADADPLGDALAAEINAIGEGAVRDAGCRSLTLAIAGVDALIPLTEDQARDLTQMVLPALIHAAGDMEIGEVVTDEFGARVELNLTDDNDGEVLMGAGHLLLADGTVAQIFEAYLPLDADTVVVKAFPAPPVDIDMARDLGLAPAAGEEPRLPQAPAGQHDINGILGEIEERTGIRPAATTVRITYRRYSPDPDAILRELTVEQAQRIVDHPISQGGLRQMGNLQPFGIEPVQENGREVFEAKAAVYGVLETGRINPAVLGVGGGGYGGIYDFTPTLGAEIGVIIANAEIVLEDANAHAF